VLFASAPIHGEWQNKLDALHTENMFGLKLWHLSDWIEENLAFRGSYPLTHSTNWFSIKGQQGQQHVLAPTRRLGCVAKHFRKQRGHVLNPPPAQQLNPIAAEHNISEGLAR